MSRHIFALLVSASTLAAGAKLARGQDVRPSETEGAAVSERSEPAAPRVVPPVLVQFAPAEYPPRALVERRAGQVGLKLTLDAEGRVTAAQITEPAGHGFDEAARSAALRFRFSPATRDGAAVAARILYTYEFKVPEAAAPLARPPQAPSARTPPARTLSVVPAQDAPRKADAVEVVVQGKSEAERLRQSAQAVHVVEMEEAQRQTADLGEVLARQQGVGVRRAGGLGSDARFSLHGLTDDQIRFFLDGIPLELSGYPFGISNVPVNVVERAEVYRGVVPVRLGADALGGAVNLVTDDDIEGTSGSLSYQAGSYGTHRLALGVRTLDERFGLLTRASAFVDYADNDYPIDVEAADERGRLFPARVYRFHDAYRAIGANVETGFVERRWAKRLLLRAFVTDYYKELQHNVVMTVPYGDVSWSELATGATLRYENVFARNLTVRAVAGHSYTVTNFLDVGECVYDWFGQCGRERRRPGEIESPPRDQLSWEHHTFGRANLSWRIVPQHTLNVSLSPTHSTRTGDERRQANPESRDPLTAQRDLFTLVSGLEYELELVDDRLENVTFFKDYLQQVRSQEPLPGDIFRERDRDTHRFGVGDAVRYRLLEWLYAKASYEWATRLPRPDEVFGDAVLVVDNLELRPEVSHNVNVSVSIDGLETRTGAWRAEVNAFLREAEDFIVLLGNDRVKSYQNVFGARSLGAEGALAWTSPGDYVALEGNATYVDLRNTSSGGTFGAHEGDRIPNRPYLFANGSARFQLAEVAAVNDELAFTWSLRYVHEFFRGWESAGLREYKQVVSSQLLHSPTLTYLVRGDAVTLSFSAEVQNLTDRPAFDFYGVQRPGRSFYFKTTAEF